MNRFTGSPVLGYVGFSVRWFIGTQAHFYTHMIRIGIVGSDNSHALAFAQLLNTAQGAGDPRWADARCVALYGTDLARNQEVIDKGEIPHLSPDLADMLARVDAVMVVWRHGDLHAAHSLPFIQAGLPVFVDKPFAIRLQDCQAMLDAAAASGSVLTSYSTTRWTPAIASLRKRARELGELAMGQVSGPADLQSEYGGVFFYANHAIEMLLALFGHGVESVYAREGRGNICCTLRWPDGRQANLNLGKSVKPTYSATLHGVDGWLSESIDITNCYADGLEVFLRMVRTGERPLSDAQLLEPIRMMHAMLRSLETGRAEAV